MKTLTEAASLLREMADALDLAKTNLTIPAQHVDINSAAEELRLLIGPQMYFSIGLRIQYSSGKPECQWDIYDGAKCFEGSTLDAAVNACKAARAPRMEGDPAAAIRMAEAALAEPLPL